MSDMTPNDNPQEKPEEINEDKFTWHEGDVTIIDEPDEIEKIMAAFYERLKKARSD